VPRREGIIKKAKITNESLSAKVQQHLIEMIENREFGESGRLPPEENLANMLGVSRVTVRAALSILMMKGYVNRWQGRGTFANYQAAQIKTRITSAKEFFGLIREKGYEASTSTPILKKTTADRAISHKLNCQHKAPIYLMEKVFFADQKPVISVINYISTEYLDDRIFEVNLARPLFNMLDELGFPKIAYDIVDIIPLAADKRLADQLKCELHTPVLLLEATVFDEKQHPVMVNREFYKEGFIRFSEVRTTNYNKSIASLP
jgi:GntR family transcriptional regulator